VRVLWSHDVSDQTRGYWAIAVALHRSGCEVVLGGPQLPAEVAAAATQEQVDVVGYRALGEGAVARVREVQAALQESATGGSGAATPALAAAGIFDGDEVAALRAAGVREVFEILAPVEQIAARLRELGAAMAAARDARV
jgi:methylmalonyl-CoA mutase cobalamin-binding domain/chain